MIFLGFVLISGIFFIFAAISGNVFNFVNGDSLAILLIADLLFSLFTFRWKEFIGGIRTMFVFRADSCTRDPRIAVHYRALMNVTLAVGLVSTMQGLISYALAIRDSVEAAMAMPLGEALCYSSFTTVYGLMLSFFLFYPVYLFNRSTDQ